MAAEIEPALQELLKSNPSRPIEVEIEFTEMPPAGQLEALGLQFQGNTAWGSLPAAKIASIASFPQVRAIRRSTRPGRTEAPRSPASKIGLRLLNDLTDLDRQEFLVTVMFRGPVPPDLKIPGLASYTDVAVGTLNRRQIEELTHRDDVISIEAQGEMKLH